MNPYAIFDLDRPSILAADKEHIHQHSEHTRTRNSKYIIIFSIFVMSASGRINELPNNYSHNHLQ